MSKQIKKASNFFFLLLRIFFIPVLWLKYRFKFERKSSKGIKRPCLILSNHQTSFDQFAVGTGFKFAINFVAGASLFRHGFLSFLMRALAKPIPYRKGNTDAEAVKNTISVIRKGGAVGMFPSGNRSFFGEESTIRPGIGKLAKKLNVPVVLVNLRGGFNTKARWKEKPSKGKMRASVTRVITPEELNRLSHEELNDIIVNELYFNEFEWNSKEKIVFRGRHKAEYIEIVLFFCPECKSINSLVSNGNEFLCTSCGMCVKINGTGFFEKVTKAENCPDTILDWSKIQLEYIKSINFSQFINVPVFSDENASLFEMQGKKDISLGQGTISMYGDRITICGKDFQIESINDMAIQNYNRFLIYTKYGEYFIDFQKRSNLIKYMISGYHLKNIIQNLKEDNYGY